MKSNLKLLLAGSLLGVCFSTVSLAQSTWNGGTGNYNLGSNWSTGLVPTSTDEVIINSGTAELTGSDNLFERAATTTINGGTLEIDNYRFLNGRGGPATFNMQSGALNQTGTYFIVGQNNSGTFNHSGGDVTLDLRRGFFLTDGAAGSNTASYNLTGGTLDVSLNGIENNSDLHNFWLGRSIGGADQFVVDGGNFNLRNSGTLGTTDKRVYLLRDSVFQVDSGNVDVDGMTFFSVGRGNNAGTAQFLVNGGDTQIGVTTAFIVGGGHDGRMELTDGEVRIRQSNGGGGDVWIADTSTTTTAIIEQSGGLFDIEGDLQIGRNAAATTASYIMTGGELRASDITIGANLNALFDFQGGSIMLEGDRTSIVNETWFQAAAGTIASYDSSGNFTSIMIPEPTTAVPLVLILATAILRRRRV